MEHTPIIPTADGRLGFADRATPADAIQVRIRWGHLDYMPRCIVTRRAVAFCSHCEGR